MPILTSVRQSPAYLYAKTYCLCAAVTLFQAAPVSSRLSQTQSGNSILTPKDQSRSKPLPSTSLESIRSPKRQLRVVVILRRWFHRAKDLAQIKKHLRHDEKDVLTYPEVAWDAEVRRCSSLHREERRFIALRQHNISSQGINSLHHFLKLPDNVKVDPRDVPRIALGGSGGGYRAMYGLTGFISGSKKLGLWDCLTWTAGVSGSCWTLAAYYTIANQSISVLIAHYLSVSKEVTHPLSVRALDTVVRSSKGVCFLIGPLIRKVESGIIGLGIMDLYGTLVTTYQFLSRKPGARLSRASFQFSKIWKRAGIDKSLQPLPILTALRRAPKSSLGVKPHTDSSLSKGRPPARALTQHQMNESPPVDAVKQKMRSVQNTNREKKEAVTSTKGFFQWFEATPLEIGCTDTNSYIPTWSWGRSFVSGRSIGRPPEQSLSLLLGQCTSAPAGPLTGYVSALLASLPQGTVMSRLLLLLNDFVRMKKWEKLWGNPIRAGHDPNPFYGHSNGADTWEAEGRIRLMDSGMSNNLPNHILARPERGADIIVAFDASSDVRSGSAIRRIKNFADDCRIELEDETSVFGPPPPCFSKAGDGSKYDLEASLLHHYAKVFRGAREDGQELYIVYCPLLPNGNNPNFDPSVSVNLRTNSRRDR